MKFLIIREGFTNSEKEKFRTNPVVLNGIGGLV